MMVPRSDTFCSILFHLRSCVGDLYGGTIREAAMLVFPAQQFEPDLVAIRVSP